MLKACDSIPNCHELQCEYYGDDAKGKGRIGQDGALVGWSGGEAAATVISGKRRLGGGVLAHVGSD